jgi:dihydropyrimidine dehydrogenase (NAD+) subunit PreA
MADLTVNCGGIISPNPFWLASAPPANSGDQVSRAFDAGWGGAVWKTLGNPIVNVSSRFWALHHGRERMIGLNNIELITDRPLDVNLREIREVKRRFPKHAVITSLMVETKAEWKEIIERSEDAGSDGHELNFGCPHGMCERGMGSAVGQEPDVLTEIASWAVEFASKPVLVKLTPNVGDILEPGMAARRSGAHGVSLINTIKSIIGVDLDLLVPNPRVGGAATNGGYCGPAVKPIAQHMVAQLAREQAFGIPISGIGGISNWRDAAEFIALGCSSVQVCTAVMHHGYRIVEDMIEGLNDYLDEHGYASVMDFVGRAVPQYKEWGELDLNYHRLAKINPDKCIGCQVCVTACMDGAHQCIFVAGQTEAEMTAAGYTHLPEHPVPVIKGMHTDRVPWVFNDECVGCNLCQLVCPVPDCIEMVEVRKAPEVVTWQDRMAAGTDKVPGGLAASGRA